MKLYWAPQTRSPRMFKLLPDTDNLDDYANRCLARPAHQAALEKSAA